MSASFDELMKAIMEEMRKTYSDIAIDHANNPRNTGIIENPDGYARITGPCGDTMEISLKVRDKKIVNAGFWTDGCGATIACGSMTTEMAKGKTIEEVFGIGQKEILEALGGLPEDHIHCALLAANTLRAAIEDYLASEKEPWRQAYKRE